MKKYLTIIGLAAAASLAGVNAQVVINNLNTAVTQNFNSYAGSLATLPTSWTASFSGTPTFSGTGTGTSNIGGAWAYGTGGEFSLGALRSGTPGNITYAVTFQNNTGSLITQLDFAWDYEQWRFANTSGWDLSGTGALAGNTTVDTKDFAGVSTGTNGSVASTGVSFSVTGLSIANGGSFGLSWVTTDVSSSDNGVAIDNFSVTAIPEPTTWALIGLGSLAMVWNIRRRRAIKG